MKTWKRMPALLAMVWLAVVVVAVAGKQSFYSSGTTLAAVNIGPGLKSTEVVSLNTTTDLDGALIKFYARPTTLAKLAPTTSPTNAATVIACGNTGVVMTNGDRVVYVHANGTLDYTTVASATTSNVTLTAGITVAGAAGDYLYELTEQHVIQGGFYGTGDGTNEPVNLENCYVSPADSPLRIEIDGTATCRVGVVVLK